jgi:hypothetical protein
MFVKPFLSENYYLKREIGEIEINLNLIEKKCTENSDGFSSSSFSSETNNLLEIASSLEKVENGLKEKINSFDLIKSKASIFCVNKNQKPKASKFTLKELELVKSQDPNHKTKFKYESNKKENIKQINIESNQRKIDLINRIRNHFAVELNQISNKKRSLNNFQKSIDRIQKQQDILKVIKKEFSDMLKQKSLPI